MVSLYCNLSHETVWIPSAGYPFRVLVQVNNSSWKSLSALPSFRFFIETLFNSLHKDSSKRVMGNLHKRALYPQVLSQEPACHSQSTYHIPSSTQQDQLATFHHTASSSHPINPSDNHSINLFTTQSLFNSIYTPVSRNTFKRSLSDCHRMISPLSSSLSTTVLQHHYPVNALNQRPSKYWQ